MSGLLSALAFGVIVPALATASILTAVLAVGRRFDLKARSRLGVALGLGLGTLAGYAGVSWPAWPPSDVTDRIPFLIIVGIISAVFEVSRPAKPWMSWGNRILLTVITLAAILGPAFAETWKTPATLLGGASIGAGMVLAWANLDALAARLSGSVFFLPLLVVTTGASLVLVLSGVLVQGRVAGVLTAALAGCWVVSWWAPSISLARGGTPIVVVALASLLLVGRFYAEAPTGSVVLLALAPAALWLVELGPLRQRAPWLRTLVATAAVLVPVALAVGLAVAAMPSDEF
jgi:hypothetical protein